MKNNDQSELHHSLNKDIIPQKTRLGFDIFFKKRASLALESNKNGSGTNDSHSYHQIDERDANAADNGIDSIAEIKPHEDVIRILRQISSSELLNPQDLVLAKRINEVQGASVQANHLLGGPNQKDALSDLDKQMLDYNDEKAGSILKDPRKSQVNIFRDANNNSVLAKALEQNSILNKKSSLNAMSTDNLNKKKKYYNRWYIPVDYWGVTKNNVPLDIVNEMLKEDENFVYNNIHNYDLKKDPNPFVSDREKSPQQIRYELLQEKIHQNYAIHAYKKYLFLSLLNLRNLVDTGKRIPASLLKLDPLSRSGGS